MVQFLKGELSVQRILEKSGTYNNFTGNISAYLEKKKSLAVCRELLITVEF